MVKITKQKEHLLARHREISGERVTSARLLESGRHDHILIAAPTQRHPFPVLHRVLKLLHPVGSPAECAHERKVAERRESLVLREARDLKAP